MVLLSRHVSRSGRLYASLNRVSPLPQFSPCWFVCKVYACDELSVAAFAALNDNRIFHAAPEPNKRVERI